MEKDFLQKLEFVGFTARMKRISDSLMYDARRIYDDLDIGIEPNWHLIFLLLKKEKQLTVTQVALELGFSHPAIIKITKKMENKGFIERIPDSRDSRKQLLQLTSKSKSELSRFEEEWSKIEQVIKDIVDHDFLEKLSEIETKLQNNSLFAGYKANK